ncbi:MAG: dihydroorotase [Pseudomonadota bacterium]|nr:dihydroorotase [Pseudomonadota bacterium]
MSSTTSILHARLHDPSADAERVTDIHLSEGKIVAIGDTPAGFSATQQIDAAGQYLIPGIIDLNTRLREPGQEQKGTIISETTAAARGGVTTVICPPDTDPVIDTPAVAELIRRRAKQSAQARVLSVGALTRGLAGEQLTEMAALKSSGCIAVSNARLPVHSNLILIRALEYAATWGIPVFVNPLDHALNNSGCAHDGRVANRLGLPGTPCSAETVAVATMLELAHESGAHIHFQQISTGRAVEMLHEAQLKGIHVTADVAAHQLHLTEMDVDGFDSNCHLLPPLRTLADRDALRQGVAEGVISAICSGHEPHEADAKLAPFPATEPGISALETLLPLTLRLVDEKLIDLRRAIALLTSGPAEIAELDSGRVTVGADADLCLIDLDREWQFAAENMLSAGHNTPFDGWEFHGQVTHTFFEGRLTWAET